MKPVLAALALGLLAAGSLPWGLPHGSTYRPPRYAGPGDRVPGRPVAGPAAPAGSPAGRTAPRGGSSPDGRAGAGPPAPARSSPSSTGASAPLAPEDLTHWSLWWELHRENLLGIRQRLLGADPGRDAEGDYLGFRSRSRTRSPFVPPGDQLLEQDVLPALITALDERRSVELSSAALVALARVARGLGPSPRLHAERALVVRLPNPTQELSETATVALGILGLESSAPALVALLANDREGRRLVRRESVPERTRAFAAYALGLLGHHSARIDVQRYAVHALTAAFPDAARGGTPDLAVACLLALGRSSLPASGTVPEPPAKEPLTPSASREALALWLLDAFRDRKHGRTVRAHAAVALGWLQAGAPAPPALRAEIVLELAKRLRSRQANQTVRRGCVLALGSLVDGAAGGADEAARELLVQIIGRAADRGSRRLARISLARIAARAEARASSAEAARLRALLLTDLARERGAEERWCALALGLLEHARRQRGQEPHAPTADALRSALAEAGAPDDVAALAVAAGLAGLEHTGPLLLGKLERVATGGARGSVLLALGLLGVQDARDALRATVDAASYQPELLREATLGLGLLGDRDALATLVAALGRAGSGAAQASLARALGRIGDRQAVAPLLSLLADRTRPGAVRAFAAAALGRIGDRDPWPWNALYADGVHYLDAPLTLFGPGGRGLLNIL